MSRPWAGFLYLAVVRDSYRRRIVGGALAEHLRTALVLAALDMARWNRRPAPGVIHHADQGCPYPSRGDCFDKAITEAFFATRECERLQRQTFRPQTPARSAIFDSIEGFYHPHRRHAALGYRSPADDERSIPLEVAA